ncbi:MAG: tRNA (N(6)-L-threonylcarbamoyladenosine(37)-C(2))-methylthiotransferase MtaB, partial [Nitrososphaerales archaeon]|nr:tRNA (N(6)-L-threonylcarbamoyladenosine(37)-C(2))-methylthiotransferase MtaB [Nitrososphaerales archaeon]
MSREFVSAGFNIVDSIVKADIYVLNTCTVTSTADSKARQALRSAHRHNPNALIVAAGCYSQRAEDELSEMPEVSLVVKNTEKDNIIELINKIHRIDNRPVNNIEQPLQTHLSRCRAMVKIQEGCNQICSYCIVPKVRGREKSINKKLIVNEINDLHERGYKEIILTGTQLGSYGFDLVNENLETLIKYIMTETSIERLRISSIQAHEISEELLDIYNKYSQRICNHFHLALQSGSNNILKLMRRKYDNSRYLEAVNLIKSKLTTPSISTDVIVGFPGETENDFNDTLKIIKSSKFSKIHFFPYSDRPGTSSYYFKNKIKPDIKKERMKIALELAKT